MKHPASFPTEYAVQACIAASSRCHQVCLQTAMNHCLVTGGKLVKPKHFRLIINCAEICHLSVNFQLGSSPFRYHICEICAEICDACALDCEEMGSMDECVEACRVCAESCRQMVGTRH
jgi:hypothetical protein